MLEYGGALRKASRQFSIPEPEWLDLSMGINPVSWQAPAMPNTCWTRMPSKEDGLLQVARQYYDCETLLPVSSERAAIQLLPMLRSPNSRVGIPKLGFAEHRKAWYRAGHELVSLETSEIDARIDKLDVLVVINPNNPTGERIESTKLMEWRTRLAVRGGWLIVDEAYMDMTPSESLAHYCPLPGLLVIRSIGQFFGLPGANTAFLLGERELLRSVELYQGPSEVTGPARWIARHALADREWQLETRQRLQEDARRLETLLNNYLGVMVIGTDLFVTCLSRQARQLFFKLAQRAVLVRLLDEIEGVRFGLPADEEGWQHLLKAFTDIHGNLLKKQQAKA